jgi:hypothetical protein
MIRPAQTSQADEALCQMEHMHVYRSEDGAGICG